MNIRMATLLDRFSIWNLFETVYNEIEDKSWFDTLTISEQFIHDTIEYGNGIVVAEDDDEHICGTIAISDTGDTFLSSEDLHDDSIDTSSSVVLMYVGVLPEYRNRGIMKQMLSYVDDVMREKGVTVITALVNPDNVNSFKGFISCGYNWSEDNVYYVYMYDEYERILVKKLN